MTWEDEKLYTMLIKAINMLIDEEVSAVDIKDGIGASEEDWNDLMEYF